MGKIYEPRTGIVSNADRKTLPTYMPGDVREAIRRGALQESITYGRRMTELNTEQNIEPVEAGDNTVGKSGEQNPVEQPKPIEDTPIDDEFEARVQAAAAARIEAEKKVARELEAKEQGNYKLLYENEMAARKKAELSAWRTRALNKYNLADEWFDSLAGETEEDILKSAKAIKKRIDDAITAQQQALLDSNVPSGPGNKRPPREQKKDGKEITRRNLAAAFNIGGLPRAH